MMICTLVLPVLGMAGKKNAHSSRAEFQSQPECRPVDLPHDFVGARSQLTEAMRKKLHEINKQNNGASIENTMLIYTSLSNFDFSTKTADVAVHGSYSFHTGDYCDDRIYNAEYKEKNSQKIKISLISYGILQAQLQITENCCCCLFHR